MADNVGYTPGTGATIAAKDIGSGVLAERVILAMGASNADVTTGLQAASGALPMVMAAGLSITGPSAQTTGNNILASDSATATDATGYASGTIEITSTGTGGGWIVEQSLGGTTWNPVPIFEASVNTGAPIVAATTATSSTRVFGFAIRCNYLRVRISTTITGGSIQARAFLSQASFAAPLVSAVQTSATNLQVGVTAVGSTTLFADVGVQYRATSTGGAAITASSHVVAAGSTNATNVKASAGRLLGWSFGNPSAGWRYVKVHNTAGTPTAGSGVIRTIAIPPGGVSNLVLEGGQAFSTGIGYTIVTGAADSDTTAVTAGDVVGDIFYA